MVLLWRPIVGVPAAVCKQGSSLVEHTVGPCTHKLLLGFPHAGMHSLPSMPVQLG